MQRVAERVLRLNPQDSECVSRLFVRASCVSIHRNADAALGVDLQVRVHFTWHNILEMLARRLGQAMVVWRNTPACGVAETYIFLCCFVASGGPMKHIISS